MHPHSPLRRPRTTTVIQWGVAAALAMFLVGCSDDQKPTEAETTFDAAALLDNCARGVIQPTYEDLLDRAVELQTAVDDLAGQTDEAHLAVTRGAWRAARRPWEASESFLFGPVETQGIDPSIDSWPVNVTDLDAVLASASPLTREFVDGLEGTLKGFHTIEYLLWGESGTLVASEITPRELEYLRAVTESLTGAVAQLAHAWQPSGGGFADQLAHAGQSGSLYVSRKAGVQELVTGMSTIADEVANGKINDPFSARDPVLEESRFSGNSLADFADNIRSLQNLYHGTYAGSDGQGVSDFVATCDAALDTRLRGEIADAIAAIESVPPPFTSAIFDHRDAVEAAQTRVRKVQQTLDQDVAPLLDRL